MCAPRRIKINALLCSHVLSPVRTSERTLQNEKINLRNKFLNMPGVHVSTRNVRDCHSSIFSLLAPFSLLLPPSPSSHHSYTEKVIISSLTEERWEFGASFNRRDRLEWGDDRSEAREEKKGQISDHSQWALRLALSGKCVVRCEGYGRRYNVDASEITAHPSLQTFKK